MSMIITLPDQILFGAAKRIPDAGDMEIEHHHAFAGDAEVYRCACENRKTGKSEYDGLPDTMLVSVNRFHNDDERYAIEEMVGDIYDRDFFFTPHVESGDGVDVTTGKGRIVALDTYLLVDRGDPKNWYGVAQARRNLSMAHDVLRYDVDHLMFWAKEDSNLRRREHLTRLIGASLGYLHGLELEEISKQLVMPNGLFPGLPHDHEIFETVSGHEELAHIEVNMSVRNLRDHNEYEAALDFVQEMAIVSGNEARSLIGIGVREEDHRSRVLFNDVQLALDMPIGVGRTDQLAHEGGLVR